MKFEINKLLIHIIIIIIIILFLLCLHGQKHLKYIS